MTERPSFLDHDPVELKFGTSGLRGLVREMTDLEVFINTQGFLRYLATVGDLAAAAPVLLGRDLRDWDPTSGLSSSPRIAAAVTEAVRQLGHRVVDCGTLPTPALAAAALAGHAADGVAGPAIMVTGSHIPPDRNGVKFYRSTGEVLKADETGILEAVRQTRQEIYATPPEQSAFDPQGMFKTAPATERTDPMAIHRFADRFLERFGDGEPLAGWRVVVYQHSSVARDLIRHVLQGLGADVVPIGRVDHFVAIDTEDVTVGDEAKYRSLVRRYGADALVSTDGDGDRPLIVDERGKFHRGDVVGVVCAEQLGAQFAAVPVSATDAIEKHLVGMDIERTRIGSPYVIDAMQRAVARGATNVVGWEANGGFMTMTPVSLGGRPLSPLPTRDAMLPIATVLLAAANNGQRISELFARLPRRATRAGLLDDFAPERARQLLGHLRPDDPQATRIRFGSTTEVAGPDDVLQTTTAPQLSRIAKTIERFIEPKLGTGAVTEINLTDGVRMYFESGDIVHFRPSGNAPQFRVYVVADHQVRADALVNSITAEPAGILRTMERDLVG